LTGRGGIRRESLTHSRGERKKWAPFQKKVVFGWSLGGGKKAFDREKKVLSGGKILNRRREGKRGSFVIGERWFQ